MKRILCYGDSNTWGTDDKTHNRLDEKTRFTKLLQKKLGKNFEVIEEGMRSRTLAIDDIKPPKGNRNGASYFAQSVYTHDPLDYIVIMLGTNDLKNRFNKDAKMCANELEEFYVSFVKNTLSKVLVNTPQIIIVAPSLIKDIDPDFAGAEEKSKFFNEEYSKVATKNNCIFVDNSILESGIDGVHLTKESHKKLAEKLASIIK